MHTKGDKMATACSRAPQKLCQPTCTDPASDQKGVERKGGAGSETVQATASAMHVVHALIHGTSHTQELQQHRRIAGAWPILGRRALDQFRHRGPCRVGACPSHDWISGHRAGSCNRVMQVSPWSRPNCITVIQSAPGVARAPSCGNPDGCHRSGNWINACQQSGPWSVSIRG